MVADADHVPSLQELRRHSLSGHDSPGKMAAIVRLPRRRSAARAGLLAAGKDRANWGCRSRLVTKPASSPATCARRAVRLRPPQVGVPPRPLRARPGGGCHRPSREAAGPALRRLRRRPTSSLTSPEGATRPEQRSGRLCPQRSAGRATGHRSRRPPDHEGAATDQGGLEDPQPQHGPFLLVAAAGGDVAARSDEDDRVGAVPRRRRGPR